jgi:hypothetical protein
LPASGLSSETRPQPATPSKAMMRSERETVTRSD